jgi:hypothetical protein
VWRKLSQRRRFRVLEDDVPDRLLVGERLARHLAAVQSQSSASQLLYTAILVVGVYMIFAKQRSASRFFNDLQARGERLKTPKSCKTARFVDRIVDGKLSQIFCAEKASLTPRSADVQPSSAFGYGAQAMRICFDSGLKQ